MVLRSLAAVTSAAALGGCCCCGTPTPVTDASVRVLAAGDPVVIKVDGKQEESLSAYTSTQFRVPAGAHDLTIDANGRAIVVKIDVKAGDDVFVGGHDTSCFAIVENPARMGAKDPRWEPGKQPPPATWALVRQLKPGEVWPEGRDLGQVADSPSTLTVEMSERLVAPVACDAPDANPAIAIGMTSVIDKVSKF